MHLVLQDPDELNARIFHYPTSAIKHEGQKINYHQFLMSSKYEDCNDAVMRIFPRINADRINEFISSVPYLTDLQREYYSVYIEARYNQIMLPAYEMAMKQDIYPEEKSDNSESFELNM